MEDDRKKELGDLLREKAEERSQEATQEQQQQARFDASRVRFQDFAEKVVRPVMLEFAASVAGEAADSEVKVEARDAHWDRVYLYILPRGRPPESYPENRQMIIFRMEPYKGTVTFFDNSIHGLGGEHRPDGEFPFESLTKEKVEELVFGYVKRMLSKQ